MALSASGGWSPATSSPDLDSQRPVDPYLVWAELSGWVGFGHADNLHVLIELEQLDLTGTCGLVCALRAMVASNPLNPTEQGRALSPFATASVSLADLATLRQAVDAHLVARFQLGLARLWTPDASGIGVLRDHIEEKRWLELVGDADTLETIGVVDDGCCLAHESLRTAYGGSFLSVWDQSQRDPPDDPWTPGEPLQDPWVRSSDIGYGVELHAPRIDQLLALHRPLGEVSERFFYEEVLRRENWGRDDRSHGAGVLHTIAGSRLDPACRKFPLVFVQLPGDTVADASGGSLGVYLLDGVRYAVKRTQALAEIVGSQRQQPLDYRTTLNVSLGSIAGPHDGSSITECALAELGADSDHVRIVLAAGNTAGKRIHAVREVAAGQAGRFDVLLPPDNPRESYVEVWLPAGAALADFTVRVTAPDGSCSGPVKVGQVALLGSAGAALGAVVFARAVSQGTRGTMVLLAVRATGQPEVAAPAPAPYGFWSIEVCTTSVVDPVPVHAWVERNDIIVGRRTPQQTRFVDDGSGAIDDASTLSSVANGANVTVVGACLRRQRAESDYSARGPVLGSREHRPQLYAPGDESASLRGLTLPRFSSGTWRRVSGTSVAAPFVTRWIALGQPTLQPCVVTTHDGRQAAGIKPEDDDAGY
jgi:hypothetical protein